MKLLTGPPKQPEMVRMHVIRVYSSSTYLATLAKRDRLMDWIEATARMSDGRMRASYLSRILYDSNVTTYLSSQSRLKKLIDRLDQPGRESLLVKLTEKKDKRNPIAKKKIAELKRSLARSSEN